jgi:hypothetical protein
MEISKILIIQSPLHLWSLLKESKNLISLNNLIYFIDASDNYMNGCKCDMDINEKNMNDSYDIIKLDKDINDYLINFFNCDEIRYK